MIRKRLEQKVFNSNKFNLLLNHAHNCFSLQCTSSSILFRERESAQTTCWKKRCVTSRGYSFLWLMKPCQLSLKTLKTQQWNSSTLRRLVRHAVASSLVSTLISHHFNKHSNAIKGAYCAETRLNRIKGSETYREIIITQMQFFYSLTAFLFAWCALQMFSYLQTRKTCHR